VNGKISELQEAILQILRPVIPFRFVSDLTSKRRLEKFDIGFMGQFDQKHAGLCLGDNFQGQAAFQTANQVMAETGPYHNDGLAAGGLQDQIDRPGALELVEDRGLPAVPEPFVGVNQAFFSRLNGLIPGLGFFDPEDFQGVFHCRQ
jgi:hypothetical protein